MISLNIHNVKDVKITETHGLFKGSHVKTINISTDEIDLVEVVLFTQDPKVLEVLK